MSMTKKCPICKKSVYPNDAKLSIADGTYHKSCAKCKVCNCQLTIKNFSTSGDDLMCKTHFMEAFARSGGSYGGDDKFKHASTRSEHAKNAGPVASATAAPAATAAKAAPAEPEPTPTPAPKVEKEPAKVVAPPAPAVVVRLRRRCQGACGRGRGGHRLAVHVAYVRLPRARGSALQLLRGARVENRVADPSPGDTLRH